MGLTIYVIVKFLLTVRHDLEMKALEHSAEIAQQVAECSKSYLDNKCSPVHERLPAMQVLCQEWELCMTRDPREVGGLRVGAEALAETLNRLFEPMTFKTMAFGSVLFFGCAFLWVTAPGAFWGAPSKTSSGTHAGVAQPTHTAPKSSSLFGASESNVNRGGHIAPATEQHHHYYGMPPPLLQSHHVSARGLPLEAYGGNPYFGNSMNVGRLPRKNGRGLITRSSGQSRKGQMVRDVGRWGGVKGGRTFGLEEEDDDENISNHEVEESDEDHIVYGRDHHQEDVDMD
ncbi:hypothetical protein HDV05_000082 [Chytridiales sp. JEL 0842]|nr:hypothetical protein HDV05_000082 [Chytridiales sp. JEL 0842]